MNACKSNYFFIINVIVVDDDDIWQFKIIRVVVRVLVNGSDW